MLSYTWAAYLVRRPLAGRPLLFGMWHGYKHCVTRWFQHFLPFWAAIQSPTLLDAPTKTRCPRHPVPSTRETLVTGLFIVHDATEILLNTAITDQKDDLRRRTEGVGPRPVNGAGDTAEVQPGSRSYALKQLHCVHRLVTQYVRALFPMGMWVQDCHWKLHAANTGSHVYRHLQVQATFFLGLQTKRGR